MSQTKRIRMFGGPNGPGKSTLFGDIVKSYNTGYFVNSDEIEAEISKTGYINLENFGLSLSQTDFIQRR